MLLCVDIGNSNIVLGVYRDEELQANWRIATDAQKMPDEYGILLLNLMARSEVPRQEIDGIVLASVVPPLTEIIVEMLREYIGLEPLVVGSGVKTGVSVRYDSPRDVGADRIVKAAWVLHHYGGPACVVDFGTATVFDALSARGEYLGGAIAPGLRIAAEALFQRTAMLRRVDLQRPARAIGTNTVDAMRSGILWGYVGLVEGMVARFVAELGPGTHVIGTGGLAPLVANETAVFEAVDPWLVLKGLRLVYEMNREQR